MTRIIAGKAGSLTLEVPSSGTRPTSDRVRESLFGALESADALRGADVLDLYAGSGALGLESASRGAASVTLVEKAPAAAAIAKRNVARIAKAIGRGSAITVQTSSVLAYLARAMGTWTLVFLDPPYGLGDAELTEALTLLRPHLTDEAFVVIERASRSGDPVLPSGLTLARHKKYGDTTLWWVHPDPRESAPTDGS